MGCSLYPYQNFSELTPRCFQGACQVFLRCRVAPSDPLFPSLGNHLLTPLRSMPWLEQKPFSPAVRAPVHAEACHVFPFIPFQDSKDQRNSPTSESTAAPRCFLFFSKLVHPIHEHRSRPLYLRPTNIARPCDTPRDEFQFLFSRTSVSLSFLVNLFLEKGGLLQVLSQP